MAWQIAARSNDELVKSLIGHALLKSECVINAMKRTDRALYVPPELRKHAYEDMPLPIGYGATISAPHMHAHCMEQLKGNLYRGANVLDIGSGSGYLVAVMARMVGNTGHVYGIEHIQELVVFSQQNLELDSEQDEEGQKINRIANIRHGDGRKGDVEHAPFDAIHIGAAVKSIPEELMQQLKVGGLMIVPVGSQHDAQQLVIVKRQSAQQFEQKSLYDVRYVPLTDERLQRQQN